MGSDLRDLTVTELLAALVATKNLDLTDTVAITEFAQHVNVQFKEPAETLESALDMALDFFNDAPDVEAARIAEKVQTVPEHDSDTCPDCGGEMMDEDDISQAMDLWQAVRGICDKYNYDVFADHTPPDIEEC